MKTLLIFLALFFIGCDTVDSLYDRASSLFDSTSTDDLDCEKRQDRYSKCYNALMSGIPSSEDISCEDFKNYDKESNTTCGDVFLNHMHCLPEEKVHWQNMTDAVLKNFEKCDPNWEDFKNKIGF